nr:hypothetical protein [Tanacetum cinerariifolium]
MRNDSWGRSSFARCLIKINSEADLIDVVTIGIPLLTRDGFTKETIRVEYEWRPPKCEACKSFSHTIDGCPKKVVVNPHVNSTNNGVQQAGKKVSVPSTVVIPSVVTPNTEKYEPKATTSVPKKNQPPKVTVHSSKKDNITMSNSYAALDEEIDEDVENVYDESANLFLNTKTGGS